MIGTESRDRPADEIDVTPAMTAIGYEVLCDWGHPALPVCELPAAAIAQAYIAMVRAGPHREGTYLERQAVQADPHDGLGDAQSLLNRAR